MMIRTQKMIQDEEALRTRVPSPPSPAPQTPVAAPKVDPFQAEAAHAEALLAPLDEIALLQLASTNEQVREVAVEAALQQLLTDHPGLSPQDIAALRGRLQERA